MVRTERPSFGERHSRLEDRLRQRDRRGGDRSPDSRGRDGFRDRDSGDRHADGRPGGGGRPDDRDRFGRGDRHEHDHDRGRGHGHHDHGGSRHRHHHHHHPHHRWYAGNWGGDWYYSYYGPQWNYWWDRYPWLDNFGLTIWGFDPVASAFGYYGYVNPYVTQTVILPGTLYDYSQPLVPADPVFDDWATLDDPSQTALPPGVSPEAMQSFDLARQAFARGNHEEALRLVDSVLQEMPSDAALHEFRALTLFAQGEYQAAAEALYAVLSAGPGWDWPTMSSLYSEPLIYTAQLRHLESYRRAHPDEAGPAFVLAYHYITCGHTEAAVGQLRQVLQLQPDDQLASRLLRQLDPKISLPALPDVTKPPEQVGRIDPATLPGSWQARRQNGDTFELVLEKGGRFHWRFTRNGRAQEINGVYAIEQDGVLALEMNEGGTMVAQVNQTGDSMDFYMVGDTRGAEPLHFVRGPREAGPEQPALPGLPPRENAAPPEAPPARQDPAPPQDPATGLEPLPGPRLQPGTGSE
ncbi:MAG: tetratricopeptide repeat protein [Planctomycetaceae bacterium]|nr:tetratricopeptide repeat protein [Planctomycetaceae bacterium]